MSTRTPIYVAVVDDNESPCRGSTMKVLLKRFALGACAILMMSVTVVSESPLRLGYFRSAEAIIGVAPGGSIVRRHAIYRTAAVASSSANANAAAANANAAAANANAAAAAAKPASPAGPPRRNRRDDSACRLCDDGAEWR